VVIDGSQTPTFTVTYMAAGEYELQCDVTDADLLTGFDQILVNVYAGVTLDISPGSISKVSEDSQCCVIGNWNQQYS
jgi:hypothetical protein